MNTRIPIGWKRKKIGDLCLFVNGNGFKSTEWANYGLPIIRIQNLNGSAEFNYFNGQTKESWLVNRGDILFAWAGTKGVSFGAKLWNGPSGVLNQHIFRVDPKKDLNINWLYLALLTVTKRIEKMAHGFKSTLLHVQKSDITSQIVYVPPLPEQKAIADLLSTWDEAIEKMERLSTKTQKLYEIQLSKFLSTSIAERIKLNTFLTEVSKRNKDLSVSQVLSVTNSKGFVHPEDQFDRQVASDNISNYKIVSKGEYAFNPSRINVGSIARLIHWDFGVLSPMYTVFKIDKVAELDSDLFLHWLNSYEAKQRIRLCAQGSVRESVSFQDFCAIGFPKIEIEEQRILAKYFNLISDEITLLKQLSEKYKTQKRGLMQKLLTGKWRIKSEIVNQYAEKIL